MQRKRKVSNNKYLCFALPATDRRDNNKCLGSLIFRSLCIALSSMLLSNKYAQWAALNVPTLN